METYPSYPKPAQGGFTVTPRWNTVIGDFDGGGEQRLSKWFFPRHDVTIRYSPEAIKDLNVVWNFYMARKGRREAFYIHDIVSMEHFGQLIGIRKGLNDVRFEIPCRDCFHSTFNLYLNGQKLTRLIQYDVDFSANAVVLARNLLAGGIITADFTGFLRMRVRFDEDRLSREHFLGKLFQTGITLKGLAPL